MTPPYREKALDEKEAVCENCGSTDDIEVHHRDKNRCNNDLDNLVVLCKGCHDTVHYGWPDSDFLRELKVDTGIQVPEPVYREALAKSEQMDVSPGEVVRGWMKESRERRIKR